MPRNLPFSEQALQGPSAFAEQIKEQDDDGHKQQNVNETTRNVQAEAEQRQNKKDDKDCPKYFHPLHAACALELEIFPERPRGLIVDSKLVGSDCLFLAPMAASRNARADCGTVTSLRKMRRVEMSCP